MSGEMTLEDALLKDSCTGMVRVVAPDTPGAKSARLSTRPLSAREGLTLAEVTLYIGRAHQIRVQHAHAGFPLWGDARYGGGQPGQQIALWAASLAVEHPTRHETMRFSAPPPEDGAWRLFDREIKAWFEENEA
jgi:23S rRNA pseudouridine1911/1915/1917 synthase